MRIWLSFAACMVGFASLNAQLSLAELVSIGLENNPATQLSWAQAEKAAAHLGIEQSAYYPTVSALAGVEHAREYKYPKGDEITFTSGGGGFFLNYLLFDCGERRANVAAARAALSSAQWQNDWALQEVMIDVLSAAYNFLKSQARLEAINLSLKETETTVQAAEDLVRAGLRSSMDLYTSKASVAEMQMMVAEQKAQFDIDRGALARALGWSADRCVEVAPLPNPTQTVQDTDIARLMADAQTLRADIAARKAEVEGALATVAAANKRYAPKVRIVGEGGGRHYWHDHTDGANYKAALQLEIPLFNGFESTYRTAQAQAEARSAQADLNIALLDVSLEVWSKSRRVTAAQEIWSIADDNLENAQKAYNCIRDKYKAGTVSIFDLILALKQLSEARIQYSDAKVRWYNSLSQLAYALGTLCESS